MSMATEDISVVLTVKRKLHPDDDNVPLKRVKSDLLIDGQTLGTAVNRREFRRAGQYILGPKIGHSPVESIVQYLAKKEGTDEFVQLKILMLSDDDNKSEKTILDERQGKMLLHTEFSLLSLLTDQEGVIHHHGMFSDLAHEEDRFASADQVSFYTGKVRKRLILVLDSVTAHDFSKKSSAFVNLQQYLLKGKKLPELEALRIFYEIIIVVESLHKKNIIHRDLKLGNIILNKSSNKITITNFCLGKYLLNEKDLLFDQRGSPAYISPDVLCGVPYKGKPSDMWALGVVLFMMFYGQFPFFESTPSALFKKIKSAEFMFPVNSDVSFDSQTLIKGLLQLKADRRLTATQVRQKLEVIIAGKPSSINIDQLVPALPGDVKKCNKPKSTVKKILSSYQTDQLVPVLSTSPVKSHSKRNILSIAFSAPSTQTIQSDPLHFNRPAAASISVRRIGQDARPLTPNEIGQYQFLIRNNGANNINISSNANNWQATIRVNGGLNTSTTGSGTSTISSPSTAANSMHVTQQMRNLSLRHNRLSMRSIALRDFRNSLNIPMDQRGDSEMPPLNQEAQNYSRFLTRMYRCAIFRNNPAESMFARNSAAVPAVAGTPSPFMRSVTSANAAATNRNIGAASMSSINAQAQLVPNIPLFPRLPASSGSTAPTTVSAFGSLPLSQPSLPSSSNRELTRSLINSITVMFLRSGAPTTAPLFNFTGIITEDLATRIAQWLINEYHDHGMIRMYFNGTSANATQKVRNFLHHCGVQMQIVNGVIKVKREQPLELLMVMTYMLQVSNYNNGYFYNY